MELEEARDQARRRSLGNIKFIGELFKLKMLTEAIMHDCVVKLLKNHDEESLECLCRLLSTIGKDLDFEKAKVVKHEHTQMGGVNHEATGIIIDGTEKSQIYSNTPSLIFCGHDSKMTPLFCVPVSLVWISILTRWTRSSKRERLHPESASCCKMCWTSER